MPSKVKKSREKIKRRSRSIERTNEQCKTKKPYRTIWFASAQLIYWFNVKKCVGRLRSRTISHPIMNANERSVIVFIAFNWAFDGLWTSKRNHFMIIIYLFIYLIHRLFVWLAVGLCLSSNPKLNSTICNFKMDLWRSCGGMGLMYSISCNACSWN